MCELLSFDVLTLRSIMHSAHLADPKSVEGSILLRTSLATLLAVDANLLKEQGTAEEQVRLLPQRDLLFEHEGVDLRAVCCIRVCPHSTERGRADSYFLINQLRLAQAEGKMRFLQTSDGVRMWVRRSLDRSVIPPLTPDAERYVAGQLHAVNGSEIVLIDATFTMPAIKQLVLQICNSYLDAIAGKTGG